VTDAAPPLPATAPPATPTNRTQRVVTAAVVPVLALLSALVVGGIVIVASDTESLRAWSTFVANPGNALSTSWAVVRDSYGALLSSSLGGWRPLSETLLEATPLILTGLSVTFAFRAGLFNIGGDGQFLAGSLASVWVGFSLDLPAALHLPLAIAAGVVGGAVWGGIAGLLKARTGAHEVISTIMLNFIALRLVDFALSTTVFRRTDRSDPISKNVLESARLPRFDDDLRVHTGLLLALAVAYGIWWLLFRSTTGFRVRAVGASPSAARYAGMAVGGTWVLAMLVAGGLAGLAGATSMLGVRHRLTGGFSNLGFDAIALALLGRSHPAGVVGAALLFGVLRAGATGMQVQTSTPVDIIVVIQAVVIVFVAAPALIRAIYRIKAARVTGPSTFSSSWGS
jgi:simple sugar transport system permease protein